MNEIRVFDFSRENREYAPRVAEEGSRVIEGYAIVFNRRSRVLYDAKAKKSFVEIIEPRAVTQDLLDRMDIKLLFNHDSNHLLGRSCYGYGTLSYEIDEYGVKYRCEMPNSVDGDNVLELVKRGDLFGCSFAFLYDKDGYVDEKIDGENVRTVVKMSAVIDFSVVVDPAYWGTCVSARSFTEPGPEKDEPAKREFQASEAKELFELEQKLKTI